VTHKSENTIPLAIEKISITKLDQLRDIPNPPGHVYLLHLPAGRTDQDSQKSQLAFQKLATFCANLDPLATVCILTTPPDAARLYPHITPPLRFQLWAAVKSYQSVDTFRDGILPQEHAALLVFTRYSSTLIHTKTRIAYTYCPACDKTTKDYGGKKHLYHEDGTTISDVWRDIQIDLSKDINPVVERLRDLFGLDQYSTLTVLDLGQCPEFAHIDVQEECDDNVSLLPNKPLVSQLIQDDCLNALKNIPDNSLDFCFADLPYNLEKKYDGYDDALETKEYFVWCNQWLSELARIIKPGHTCAILNIPFGSIHHYQHLATVLNFQTWIVWDSLAFPKRKIMPAHYAILCFSKGVARPLPGLRKVEGHNPKNEYLTPQADLFCARAQCVRKRQETKVADRGLLSDLWHDIYRLNHNSRRVDHPCQLPPSLMRRMFSIFTSPGEIILDCFNGAGTSTLVADQMGRRYIGIEMSKEYHSMALERHAEIRKGLDPFRKRTDIPKSKNNSVRRIDGSSHKVSKKTLQLEVKRIAELLGRIPSRDEVTQMSQYPSEYYETSFVSWGEACAAARTTGMTEFPLDIGASNTHVGVDDASVINRGENLIQPRLHSEVNSESG
jgi:site-specific DNA-methyltransferase (adenine-specific)